MLHRQQQHAPLLLTTDGYPHRFENRSVRSTQMSGNDFGRKAAVLTAITLSLVGMGLSIGAIATPSWQVVNLQEYNSIHEHGLWLDCTRHSRTGNVLLRRYATITEPLHCVYKFDYDKYSGTFDLEDDNSPVGEVNRHKFYGWHTATLILLSLAILTTFLSVCLGMCSCCYYSLAFLFTAITLLTTFLSVVAEGLFFFYSHRADNRFIKGIVGTYEQRVGVAFFLQMAACVFHFLSFLVSLLFTYFALASKSSASDKFSANRSSRTNMTNIGRSMEFDTPLIYPSHPAHHQSQPTHLRPPHYSKQDLFDRGVADSMPEISSGQSFPAEILPPRVRRKSETCV
uniref:Clc-like protein n=1 Tax=Steinernema glaseri TaxID=37863 RepID=A0A1I7YKW1_9BILA